MKKITLIAACMAALIVNAQSKKFQFKLGDEYGLPKKAEDLSFFGDEQNGIVNLSLKKEELYLTRFNAKNLSQAGEKVIPVRDATRNMLSEIVVDFSPNYYWLRSDWDKDRQIETLYATTVDVKNGKLGATDVKLIEAGKMGGDAIMTGWYSYKLGNKYDFQFDANHTKLMVNYRLAPLDRNDKKNFDRLGIHVFDNQLKKLWSNEFTMPYTEAVMDNIDFSVDADGNAYLLAKVYDSDKRKEKDKATGTAAYHLEVFKFTKDNKQVIHARLNADQYFIKESSLIENSNHDMVIACTYSKEAKGKGTEGIFLGILNKENKIENFKKGFYKFPASELAKFEKRREARKREKKEDYEIPNLTVTNVLVERDGSVLIACEEQYIRERTSGGGFNANGGMSRTTTTYTYHYDDVLAAKVNAAGEIEWLKKIPKRQQGTRGKGTMSFKLISDETGYYFLYLDNKKNENMEDDDTPARHQDGAGGQVFVTKIDNKGTMTKEIIFDTRDEDVMIYPSQFSKINDKQFIGRARIKKTLFQPLLITVK